MALQRVGVYQYRSVCNEMLEYTTVLIHIIILIVLIVQFVYCVVFSIEFLYVYCHFILPLLIFNGTVVFCNIVYTFITDMWKNNFCILNMFLPCLNKDIIIIIIIYYLAFKLVEKRGARKCQG